VHDPVFPMAWPVTEFTWNAVCSADSRPTVTATPTLTWRMMMARACAPCREPSGTGFGLAAGCTVSPARYCPGLVPRGTRTAKRSSSRVSAASFTCRGRPDTQQAGPWHGPAGAS